MFNIECSIAMSYERGDGKYSLNRRLLFLMKNMALLVCFQVENVHFRTEICLTPVTHWRFFTFSVSFSMETL